MPESRWQANCSCDNDAMPHAAVMVGDRAPSVKRQGKDARQVRMPDASGRRVRIAHRLAAGRSPPTVARSSPSRRLMTRTLTAYSLTHARYPADVWPAYAPRAASCSAHSEALDIRLASNRSFAYRHRVGSGSPGSLCSVRSTANVPSEAGAAATMASSRPVAYASFASSVAPSAPIGTAPILDCRIGRSEHACRATGINDHASPHSP